MRLNPQEQAMLDGREGPAIARAMDLLVRYGEALGAERLVDTNNVCGTIGATTPLLRDFAARRGGFDAVFSEFNLDSDEVVPTPKVRAYSCHLQLGIDPLHAEQLGTAPEVVTLLRRGEEFVSKMGVQLMNTCTPYLVGNIPVKGEHCAWMESSAIIYINSVLGARTNAEGRESAGASMITGKTPYWGYHVDDYRYGTHLVEIDTPLEDIADWGLLGYWVGDIVQDRIPVLTGVTRAPNLGKLKHFGAAASSSGGVEMYHIAGVTPEARTLEEAFGPRKPVERLHFGAAERRAAYASINAMARDTKVDYVMLGCPHYSIEQIWEACRLLEGRKVHPESNLWIFTPRAIRHLADQNGYTRIIEDAGGFLMSDTCSAMSRATPKGVRVAAVDSVKQAHYLPSILGIQTWFGTTAECIDAAVTGHWSGGLR